MNSFPWIRGSFYSRKSLRKFPWLIAFHGAADGALIGVIFLVCAMSSIALHAQYLWTVSFSKLEVTRDLNQKIMESTAMLETHLLNSSRFPKLMVSTKAENLVYLDSPTKSSQELIVESNNLTLRERLISSPLDHGY